MAMNASSSLCGGLSSTVMYPSTWFEARIGVTIRSLCMPMWGNGGTLMGARRRSRSRRSAWI